MSEVATPEVATPPVEAPVNESLLPPPQAPAAPTPPPAGDAPVWTTKVPEKFHVKGTDGKVDVEATLLKQSESYTNLEKVKGPTPPAKADDYTFTPPEQFKELKFDDALSAGFRDRAHKAGFTQAQYEMVMGEYLSLVPQVLDSVVKASAQEAKAELSKVWQSPAVFEAQLNNAARAINNAPESIRQDLHARFSRDPLFIQFAAALGAEQREDRPPSNPDGSTGGGMTLEQLQSHPAYRDPKHPEHAAYSQRAMDAAKRMTPGN